MLFKNLNIHKKLFSVLGFLIFIIIIVGEWSIYQSSQINKRVNDLYTQEILPLENLSNLKGALYRIRDRTLRLADSKDQLDIKKHKKIINIQKDRILKELDLYDNTRLSKKERYELKRFKDNFNEYMQIITNKIYSKLKYTYKEEDINNILFKEAIKEFREAREALNELSEYQISRAKLRHKHSNKMLSNQIFIVQAVMLFIILLSFYLSKKLTNSILIPINKINKALYHISKSDFSKSISFESKDEFGDIVYMLNDNIKLLQSTFKELDTLANYDPLTGLINRRVFTKELNSCNNKCSLKNTFTVLFIDIDNFKNINDTYGHNTGDELLKIITKRIQSKLRQSDIFARLGGDEFAIILKNIKTTVTPGDIANKIIEVLQNPYKIEEHTLFSSVSIGIYVSDTTIKSTTDEIMSFADIAMYEAKNNGKNRYIYFDKKMYNKILQSNQLENNLRDAFKNYEFKIYYQPIIDPKTDSLYGVETLLRWERDGSIISPLEFIPKLESNGMIIDITYYIIEGVFKMITDNSFKSIVSINLSILQFYDKNFINFLKRMLNKYQSINPNNIYFEITETVFAQNNDFIFSEMKLIKHLGFNFSLDDFGTGYSSLSCLKDYPISTLKIDKSFISNILLDKKSQNLLDAIILMSKSLNLSVIIEGVENKKTLDAVTKNNHIKIQGYYYYRPMPSKEFVKMIS